MTNNILDIKEFATVASRYGEMPVTINFKKEGVECHEEKTVNRLLPKTFSMIEQGDQLKRTNIAASKGKYRNAVKNIIAINTRYHEETRAEGRERTFLQSFVDRKDDTQVEQLIRELWNCRDERMRYLSE